MHTCPNEDCQGDSKIINSRHNSVRNTIMRRRKCLTCGKRWSTLEISLDAYENLLSYKQLVQNLKGAKPCQ